MHARSIDRRSLQATLKALLGRSVEAKTTRDGVNRKRRSGTLMAIYRSEDGQLVGLIAHDLAFACYSGAALALIPVNVATQGIRMGRPDESLLDNNREVMNVLAQHFGDEDRRVILESVTSDIKNLSGDVKAFLQAPPHDLDLEVTIDGYGSGKIAVLWG